VSVAIVIELLLKSGLIAGAGLALAAALRFRPAVDRVDILRVTVCALILLPLVMTLAPALSLPLLPPSGTSPSLSAPPVAWAGVVEPVEGMALSGSIFWPTAADLALWAWGAGAVLVLGRFALGVWTLQRWTRKGRAVAAAAWTAPLDRLPPARRPRLVVSPAVGSPLSWGVPPGVVLIGEDQLARPGTARAVLAHELAHLQRQDWIFLVLSRLALALFWFNPLVWKLHTALSACSEEAADAAALGEVGRGSYARALVDLAADFNPPAALGMAGPAETLTRRIACIMKTSAPLRRRPLVMVIAVGALIGVATPIAALELTPRGQAPSQAPLAPMAQPDPVEAVDSVDLVTPAVPAVDAVEAVAAVDAAAPVVSDGDWLSGQDAYAPPPPPPPPPLPPAPPAPPAPYAAMAAPPAPPFPPAPPAPPARAPRAGWVHSNSRPLTAEERQAVVEARQAAAEARIHAQEARREAVEARARARARVAGAPEARVRARAAIAEAARARSHAAVAREQAAREVANARVHMAQGADQMIAGAGQMREESARLRDPAYRATQIERARERGETVTDSELQALSLRLPAQAERLERRAVEMRERAARQPS
jgi:beta-lactamase regulating signal transducer with metallopeptidase domain